MSSPEPSITVLASRVRTEEKRIMAALEKRSVAFSYLDARELSVTLGGSLPAHRVVLNREIGQYARAMRPPPWRRRARPS